MSNYDPTVPMLRQLLALSILGRLEEAGFVQEPPKRKLVKPEMAEKIFSRIVGEATDGMKVMVYTTVIGDGDTMPYEVRLAGSDAIRVSAVYVTKDGETRGLTSDKRVNRTGDIDDIVDRMVTRMRDAWRSCKTGARCYSCNAPKFATKNGKQVCAEICWKSDEEKARDSAAFKYRKRRRHWGPRY